MASQVALIPGFGCIAASTLTAVLTERSGRRLGQGSTIRLRELPGIPLWVFGLAGAIANPARDLFPPDMGNGRQQAA